MEFLYEREVLTPLFSSSENDYKKLLVCGNLLTVFSDQQIHTWRSTGQIFQKLFEINLEGAETPPLCCWGGDIFICFVAEKLVFYSTFGVKFGEISLEQLNQKHINHLQKTNNRLKQLVHLFCLTEKHLVLVDAFGLVVCVELKTGSNRIEEELIQIRHQEIIREWHPQITACSFNASSQMLVVVGGIANPNQNLIQNHASSLSIWQMKTPVEWELQHYVSVINPGLPPLPPPAEDGDGPLLKEHSTSWFGWAAQMIVFPIRLLTSIQDDKKTVLPGTIQQVSLSPNGKFIALLDTSGRLSVREMISCGEVLPWCYSPCRNESIHEFCWLMDDQIYLNITCDDARESKSYVLYLLCDEGDDDTLALKEIPSGNVIHPNVYGMMNSHLPKQAFFLQEDSDRLKTNLNLVAISKLSKEEAYEKYLSQKLYSKAVNLHSSTFNVDKAHIGILEECKDISMSVLENNLFAIENDPFYVLEFVITHTPKLNNVVKEMYCSAKKLIDSLKMDTFDTEHQVLLKRYALTINRFQQRWELYQVLYSITSEELNMLFDVNVFCKFRDIPLTSLALKVAESGQVEMLKYIYFQYAQANHEELGLLWASRCEILAALPAFISPNKYRTLLPALVNNKASLDSNVCVFHCLTANAETLEIKIDLDDICEEVKVEVASQCEKQQSESYLLNFFYIPLLNRFTNILGQLQYAALLAEWFPFENMKKQLIEYQVYQYILYNEKETSQIEFIEWQEISKKKDKWSLLLQNLTQENVCDQVAMVLSLLKYEIENWLNELEIFLIDKVMSFGDNKQDPRAGGEYWLGVCATLIMGNNKPSDSFFLTKVSTSCDVYVRLLRLAIKVIYGCTSCSILAVEYMWQIFQSLPERNLLLEQQNKTYAKYQVKLDELENHLIAFEILCKNGVLSFPIGVLATFSSMEVEGQEEKVGLFYRNFVDGFFHNSNNNKCDLADWKFCISNCHLLKEKLFYQSSFVNTLQYLFVVGNEEVDFSLVLQCIDFCVTEQFISEKQQQAFFFDNSKTNLCDLMVKQTGSLLNSLPNLNMNTIQSSYRYCTQLMTHCSENQNSHSWKRLDEEIQFLHLLICLSELSIDCATELSVTPLQLRIYLNSYEKQENILFEDIFQPLVSGLVAPFSKQINLLTTLSDILPMTPQVAVRIVLHLAWVCLSSSFLEASFDLAFLIINTTKLSLPFTDILWPGFAIDLNAFLLGRKLDLAQTNFMVKSQYLSLCLDLIRSRSFLSNKSDFLQALIGHRHLFLSHDGQSTDEDSVLLQDTWEVIDNYCGPFDTFTRAHTYLIRKFPNTSLAHYLNSTNRESYNAFLSSHNTDFSNTNMKLCSIYHVEIVQLIGFFWFFSQQQKEKDVKLLQFVYELVTSCCDCGHFNLNQISLPSLFYQLVCSSESVGEREGYLLEYALVVDNQQDLVGTLLQFKLSKNFLESLKGILTMETFHLIEAEAEVKSRPVVVLKWQEEETMRLEKEHNFALRRQIMEKWVDRCSTNCSEFEELVNLIHNERDLQQLLYLYLDTHLSSYENTVPCRFLTDLFWQWVSLKENKEEMETDIQRLFGVICCLEKFHLFYHWMYCLTLPSFDLVSRNQRKQILLYQKVINRLINERIKMNWHFLKPVNSSLWWEKMSENNDEMWAEECLAQVTWENLNVLAVLISNLYERNCYSDLLQFALEKELRGKQEKRRIVIEFLMKKKEKLSSLRIIQLVCLLLGKHEFMENKAGVCIGSSDFNLPNLSQISSASDPITPDEITNLLTHLYSFFYGKNKKATAQKTLSFLEKVLLFHVLNMTMKKNKRLNMADFLNKNISDQDMLLYFSSSTFGGFFSPLIWFSVIEIVKSILMKENEGGSVEELNHYYMQQTLNVLAQNAQKGEDFFEQRDSKRTKELVDFLSPLFHSSSGILDQEIGKLRKLLPTVVMKNKQSCVHGCIIKASEFCRHIPIKFLNSIKQKYCQRGQAEENSNSEMDVCLPDAAKADLFAVLISYLPIVTSPYAANEQNEVAQLGILLKQYYHHFRCESIVHTIGADKQIVTNWMSEFENNFLYFQQAIMHKNSAYYRSCCALVYEYDCFLKNSMNAKDFDVVWQQDLIRWGEIQVDAISKRGKQVSSNASPSSHGLWAALIKEMVSMQEFELVKFVMKGPALNCLTLSETEAILLAYQAFDPSSSDGFFSHEMFFALLTGFPSLHEKYLSVKKPTPEIIMNMKGDQEWYTLLLNRFAIHQLWALTELEPIIDDLIEHCITYSATCCLNSTTDLVFTNHIAYLICSLIVSRQREKAALILCRAMKVHQRLHNFNIGKKMIVKFITHLHEGSDSSLYQAAFEELKFMH